MISQTITYSDFDGNEHTETLWFGFKKSELAERSMRYGMTLHEILQKIVQTKDWDKMMDHFKWVVIKSYGEKSEDGRRFLKTEEIHTNFESSMAYDEIFMKIFQDEDYATQFINGIMPADMQVDVTSENIQAQITALNND